jgi:hypothetical protein
VRPNSLAKCWCDVKGSNPEVGAVQ